MTTGAYGEQPEVLAYRVKKAQEAVAKLEEWRREVDQARAKEEAEALSLAKEVQQLSVAVDAMRSTLTKFALTIAGSAIVFSLSVLVATGKL